MLPALASVVGQFVDWLSKDEVRGRQPKCFEKYPKTRVVLDCTEIVIEKSKCLTCKICSYSHYYADHTIKVMVGCAPSGTITFVSPFFSGKSSDKKYFWNLIF